MQKNLLQMTVTLQNYTKESSKGKWSITSAPWVLPMDMKLFNKTQVWTNLKPLVEESLGKQVCSIATFLKFHYYK